MRVHVRDHLPVVVVSALLLVGSGGAALLALSAASKDSGTGSGNAQPIDDNHRGPTPSRAPEVADDRGTGPTPLAPDRSTRSGG